MPSLFLFKPLYLVLFSRKRLWNVLKTNFQMNSTIHHAFQVIRSFSCDVFFPHMIHLFVLLSDFSPRFIYLHIWFFHIIHLFWFFLFTIHFSKWFCVISWHYSYIFTCWLVTFFFKSQIIQMIKWVIWVSRDYMSLRVHFQAITCWTALFSPM